MVAPLEEVREGGDCKEDEAVEVGVKEGQELDDRLCREEEGAVGKGRYVRRLWRSGEDWDCDVAAVDVVAVADFGGRVCTFRSRR